jgi:inner membrane protein
VGAAIGEAGLKRKTPLGSVTLMIAANLPDLDVLVFATGSPAIAFRRGWTHGMVAQLLLPLALTAVIASVARLRATRGGALRRPDVDVRWLLALSYVGLYSHVFLDYLNNYGIRLLAPLDWRWFYGDAVFIIDLWLWLVLGTGVWIARRRRRVAPAIWAIGVAVFYVAVMLGSARAARPIVSDAWQELRGTSPQALMVGPVPLTPFRRDVIVDAGDHYETGIFSWWPSGVTFDARTVPKNGHAPAVAKAREADGVRAFLVWSRFPYWELRDTKDGTLVTVKDMRFPGRFSASTIVRRQDDPALVTPADDAASPGSSHRTDR